METIQSNATSRSESHDLNRRMAIGRLVISGAAAALLARDHRVGQAQAATPEAGECVAVAPTLDASGIAFVPLVSGVVRDMPAGPIDVRISRLAMAPGTVIAASAVPYPALMYIESGTTACPGEAGRIVYAPDGTMVEESASAGVQYTPAGSMQYIPAGIPDGAGNEGAELMSSIIIELVPLAAEEAPVPGTPSA